MKRKTVENYSEAEFESGGLSGTLKNKKKRRSVILPLLLSILGAVVIWLFVLAENNTVAGITVQVVGNEQLMSYNYTVSSVSPATVKVVLRGKRDQINRIKNDKSQITASVCVFPTDDANGNYIFASAGEVKACEKTLDLNFDLPEGIRCSSKSVKVTISESYSESVPSDKFKINFTNYTLAKNCSLGEMSVVEPSLTVSGDERTVKSIGSIGLNIDWQMEIAGNLKTAVVPVAYDTFGGAIDSRYLHFEPQQLTVEIPVIRTKTFTLKWNGENDPSAVYSFAPSQVTLSGPIQFIDGINDEILLDGGEDLVFTDGKAVVEFDAARFGSSVKIVTDGGAERITPVKVTREETFTIAEIQIPRSEIKICRAQDKICTVISEYLTVRVKYYAAGNQTISRTDLQVLLDVSTLPEGSYDKISPVVTVKATGKLYYVEIVNASVTPFVFKIEKDIHAE